MKIMQSHYQSLSMFFTRSYQGAWFYKLIRPNFSTLLISLINSFLSQ